ncbi:histone PARylation factor 1 [Rhodnius prolixus]|uniref:Zf-CCHH domain-containing protein n=1 Tax=Rhodnius prolixus TaxID=13249 RepID=R4G838_RHOPR
MDNRSACKYGENCYQKNPEHLKKYKHKGRNENDSKSPSKKFKSTVDGAETSTDLAPDEHQMVIVTDLPQDTKEKIRLLFLVEMPDDFYEFYEFCKSISPASPRKALKPLNLELVGPFDVLNGAIMKCTKETALRHYRYFYDPPEFQTLLKGDEKEQLHYGYFRDDPKEFPCCVARNKAAVSPAISCVAGNLFGTVNVHAEEVKGTADIFRKMQIQKIQSALVKWAKQKKFTLDTVTASIKARRSKVVAKTFNGIGVVVPYDKKTDVGYRPLAVSDDELKQILKKIASANTNSEQDVAWSKLQPVITAANIANDECDFGTSLELGLDMFAFGEESLHATIEQVLCTTYNLLQRNNFADILRAHLKSRKRDSNLNTII